MLKDLLNLYVELTESPAVTVKQENHTIEIRIIARWFDNMSQVGRLDYLTEAIEAIYPELVSRFNFKFIALSPREMN